MDVGEAMAKLRVKLYRGYAVCAGSFTQCISGEEVFRRAEWALSHLVAYARRTCKILSHCRAVEEGGSDWWDYWVETSISVYDGGRHVFRARVRTGFSADVRRAVLSPDTCDVRSAEISTELNIYIVDVILAEKLARRIRGVPSHVLHALHRLVEEARSSDEHFLSSARRTTPRVVMLDVKSRFMFGIEVNGFYTVVSPEYYSLLRLLAAILGLGYEEKCTASPVLLSSTLPRQIRRVLVLEIKRRLYIKVSFDDLLRLALSILR